MADYVQLNDQLLELQNAAITPRNTDLGDGKEDDEDCVGSLITLNQILSHPKAFDLFVHHVAKEFSIECLLSYVEFVQFKKFMYNHMKVLESENDIRQRSIELHNAIEERKGSLCKSEIEIDINYGGTHNNNDNSNNNNNNNGNGRRITHSHDLHHQERSMGFQDVEFPSTVPKSAIVYKDNIDFESNNFKDKAKYKIYKLYCKYIRTGCDLEINISHRSRQVLVSMMDDYESWMTGNKYKNLNTIFLMHIFDKCIAQMRNLLTSSYMRFKHSNQFVKLATQCVFVNSP